ncbi:hypothetical protein N7455_001823 [Penicillium solitum]|uniref:uncharacterized protein n=1 Tax=Penicillium solitum TaxID=60172 RepID=UPI0032C46967|nr:hypothetical protein N7455_001823 [Penicillium solitum]
MRARSLTALSSTLPVGQKSVLTATGAGMLVNAPNSLNALINTHGPSSHTPAFLANGRRNLLQELSTLRSIIVDLGPAILYADQATHDNLEAWRSVRGTVQGLRYRLSQGDQIRTSDVRRVRAQVLAGVGRGHTVQFAAQAVAQCIEDIQSALDAVIHRCSD